MDKTMHSNNAAELSGLIMAITQAKTIGLTDLCVYTDSKYIMETTNNSLNRWAQFDFLNDDGLPRPNSGLWRKLNNVRKNINLD